MKYAVQSPEPVVAHQPFLSRNIPVMSSPMCSNSTQDGHFNAAYLPGCL